MSIHLNGTKIPGYAQKVSVDLKLASEDMSGNSSSTPQAETGDKPKSMKVQTTVRFIDADQLSLIINLAEAKTATGERMIYNVINATANAINMRQVVFNETLSAKENDTTEDWSISFSLVEYQSVPEKKEARQAEKKVKEQTATGAGVSAAATAATATTPAAIAEQAVELTQFEKIVKAFDNRIGGK